MGEYLTVYVFVMITVRLFMHAAEATASLMLVFTQSSQVLKPSRLDTIL